MVGALRAGLAAAMLACVAPATAPAQSFLERSRRDDVTQMSDDHPAMRAAFAKARRTLGGFLKTAERPEPGTSGHSVKIGLRDEGVTEYFWVSDLRGDGASFVGRLANTPRRVRGYQLDQSIRFSRAEIVDWTYRQGARRKGNFTACALLTQEPAAERAEYMRRTGLVCGR
ncbi:MAG: DUF2314 domain-containing protein [Methylobacteriaceae bacterium]|nr:DUF2314 domain-containing protein [Methylobacteriaceae bacterium]